jgi:hypothetical protein
MSDNAAEVFAGVDRRSARRRRTRTPGGGSRVVSERSVLRFVLRHRPRSLVLPQTDIDGNTGMRILRMKPVQAETATIATTITGTLSGDGP